MCEVKASVKIKCVKFVPSPLYFNWNYIYLDNIHLDDIHLDDVHYYLYYLASHL
ncbi:hypothetical protein MNV_1520003 [Candidatus Methanoperedens nitroreducens]|uniref:Uncharacterized protein n=1 Tax=Candidatus Methanoperedens nitratireducens TaxID=1392998 RepID=A0A284VLF6_9EURY|nr:hypothetical protein MNV_1520003 [Candidatus Methanoperedens nitroreducens]